MSGAAEEALQDASAFPKVDGMKPEFFYLEVTVYFVALPSPEGREKIRHLAHALPPTDAVGYRKSRVQNPPS
jgi:hypothetical protein